MPDSMPAEPGPIDPQRYPLPAPSPAVTLYDDGGIAWNRVSPKLAHTRLIVALVVNLVLMVALAVVAVLWWRWAWIGVGLFALGAVFELWLIPRQVRAITWAELGDEVVIRQGRLLRSLVAIPYGRLQYVDLTSGPLLRHYGLATLTMNTASPMSSGEIPGMPLEQAEALRERLMRRAEAERAGL